VLAARDCGVTVAVLGFRPRRFRCRRLPVLTAAFVFIVTLENATYTHEESFTVNPSGCTAHRDGCNQQIGVLNEQLLAS
jgi:hypothetical protein